MRAISLPFRFDGYGTIASTSDLSRIWADKVRTVVSTYPGERVMRPTFGARLPDNLFEAIEDTEELVVTDITDAFTEWLPEVTFEGVSIEESDEPNGVVQISVNYTIPNVLGDPDSSYSVII